MRERNKGDASAAPARKDRALEYIKKNLTGSRFKTFIEMYPSTSELKESEREEYVLMRTIKEHTNGGWMCLDRVVEYIRNNLKESLLNKFIEIYPTDRTFADKKMRKSTQNGNNVDGEADGDYIDSKEEQVEYVLRRTVQDVVAPVIRYIDLNNRVRLEHIRRLSRTRDIKPEYTQKDIDFNTELGIQRIKNYIQPLVHAILPENQDHLSVNSFILSRLAGISSNDARKELKLNRFGYNPNWDSLKGKPIQNYATAGLVYEIYSGAGRAPAKPSNLLALGAAIGA